MAVLTYGVFAKAEVAKRKHKINWWGWKSDKRSYLAIRKSITVHGGERVLV